MLRLTASLPALLLAVCGTVAAQTTPASTQPPVAASTQAAAARLPLADAPKAAASSAPAASLSPQQQRLIDDADQLLDLAQKLKAEVDKTNQYTLSLKTLRRAEDIEKLAKNLQKQIQKQDH